MMIGEFLTLRIQGLILMKNRLSAVESSLARVEALLLKQIVILEPSSSPSVHLGEADSHTETTSTVAAVSQKVRPSRPLAADYNSRTAPMSLIRDMTQHIVGAEKVRPDSYDLDDVISRGLITEEMARTLLTGYQKLDILMLYDAANSA